MPHNKELEGTVTTIESELDSEDTYQYSHTTHSYQINNNDQTNKISCSETLPNSVTKDSACNKENNTCLYTESITSIVEHSADSQKPDIVQSITANLEASEYNPIHEDLLEQTTKELGILKLVNRVADISAEQFQISYEQAKLIERSDKLSVEQFKLLARIRNIITDDVTDYSYPK